MVLEADFIEEGDNQYNLVGEPDFVIPLTLRDPLTSLVDRVKGRELLQQAAALEQTFSYELLLAISSLDTDALDKELKQLVASELLYQKGTSIHEATFQFKHSLIRDAAYSLLTKADSESYHRNIGCILEERFPASVKAQPEIVAHHFTEARNYEKALHYWYEAGRQSATRSAHNEAVGHFEQGLKQVPNIETSVQRNKSELLLQTALGNSLRATKGWSADCVKHAYKRALQLSEENGFDEHTFPAMFGMWTWNFVRAALGEAQTLAEHLLNITDNMDEQIYKALALEAQGFTLFAQGKFAAAHAKLEGSISLCNDNDAAAYLNLSAQDPRVHVRLYDGKVLWFLGYPDQALQSCTEAQRYADASHHPFSLAMAQTISLRVHQFRGEADLVAEQSERAIALCEEHDFIHYLAVSIILRGWASAQQGEYERGIAEIQTGLEKAHTTGAVLYESYVLALLAETFLKGDQYRQALGSLDQAQQLLKEENSERFYAAEIHRLRGQIYLRSGHNLDQVEQCFLDGLEIAREQGARSLELKISLSLCDLHTPKRSADRHRSQLKQIYKSFSEGFGTIDLIQAKARLAKT